MNLFLSFSKGNKDQSLIKWAVLINRFLYSTTVQNFTHLSYSFRVTKPIIGAGRWHGPKNKIEFDATSVTLQIRDYMDLLQFMLQKK